MKIQNYTFEMPICEAYLKGSMKKNPTPFSIKMNQMLIAGNLFALILNDHFRNVLRYTYHNKWFILFICAKSKHMTVYFMKDKTEPLDKLKLYKKEFLDMYGYKTKILQCDHDKLFVDKVLKKFCLVSSCFQWSGRTCNAIDYGQGNYYYG